MCGIRVAIRRLFLYWKELRLRANINFHWLYIRIMDSNMHARYRILNQIDVCEIWHCTAVTDAQAPAPLAWSCVIAACTAFFASGASSSCSLPRRNAFCSSNGFAERFSVFQGHHWHGAVRLHDWLLHICVLNSFVLLGKYATESSYFHRRGWKKRTLVTQNLAAFRTTPENNGK